MDVVSLTFVGLAQLSTGLGAKKYLDVGQKSSNRMNLNLEKIQVDKSRISEIKQSWKYSTCAEDVFYGAFENSLVMSYRLTEVSGNCLDDCIMHKFINFPEDLIY